MASDTFTREVTLVFLLALGAMVGVFFACGGDDDDDGGGDADDDNGLPTSQCDEIQQFVQSCSFPSDLIAINQSSACFNTWCAGGGYDEIGWLANYDFNPSCFSGACQDVYDNFTDASSPIYDECYSTRFGMRGGGECGEPSYY